MSDATIWFLFCIVPTLIAICELLYLNYVGDSYYETNILEFVCIFAAGLIPPFGVIMLGIATYQVFPRQWNRYARVTREFFKIVPLKREGK